MPGLWGHSKSLNSLSHMAKYIPFHELLPSPTPPQFLLQLKSSCSEATALPTVLPVFAPLPHPLYYWAWGRRDRYSCCPSPLLPDYSPFFLPKKASCQMMPPPSTPLLHSSGYAWTTSSQASQIFVPISLACHTSKRFTHSPRWLLWYLAFSVSWPPHAQTTCPLPYCSHSLPQSISCPRTCQHSNYNPSIISTSSAPHPPITTPSFQAAPSSTPTPTILWPHQDLQTIDSTLLSGLHLLP